jgi:hypothetical protein
MSTVLVRTIPTTSSRGSGPSSTAALPSNNDGGMISIL